MSEKYAVGLMSGTSLDGVDAVLVKIAGYGVNTEIEVIDFASYDIDDALRQRIIAVCHPDTSSVDLITSLNMELGKLWSLAVSKVLEQAGFEGTLDYIASHGQTIYHLPNAQAPLYRSTLQIGDPSYLAYDHQTQVVFNFRMMDMVAGGDGAPLVPYTEFVLYRQESETVLLQNIGGIGNVTVIPAGASLDDVSAFDTGPGNMMMNAAVMHFYEKPYDKDGVYGSKGTVIEPLYNELISHPYLNVQPPKSTGREMFGEDVVARICEMYPEQADDVIFTLTKFTAYTISDAYKRFVMPNHKIDQVVVGGGGAYNPILMRELRSMLPGIDVVTQEDLGHSSDAKEAIAFAILGNETLHGQASNVPTATGAKIPVILGQICPNPFPK
ncbi:anhydro-N-acetylmuramic acid kinase [Erysipelothrix sp. HDW6C]|uniref:anhydro-N-acetylmuramic acid kinase AnmK n=1 Tax=Erysipelothrix sp. HDW6C TaxID=2714930 RepID=UPI00140AFC68|nr:anhydro-N-acetylmuramic acid kinase AnmK [Erysipelothrix sp. HDW6C]QIK70022.1 anhydro-N-acetylmuramic acid kinase [Erysipelothrix sp. HDW6C]